jgi:hypothetical protein
MIALPEAELAFYYAAIEQIDPADRQAFMERVANTLDALCRFCEPGPGDVDRAIRLAFEALWVPPPDPARTAGRWHRSAAGFERISKMAAEPVE